MTLEKLPSFWKDIPLTVYCSTKWVSTQFTPPIVVGCVYKVGNYLVHSVIPLPFPKVESVRQYSLTPGYNFMFVLYILFVFDIINIETLVDTRGLQYSFKDFIR
jgi:hypothetical protein